MRRLVFTRAFFVRCALKGASKGGKIRAAKLSPDRRRDIARAAAKARWANHKKPNGD